LDLLRKLPGVAIGQDENLMLNGTSTPTVMIDGKMTYLSGKQLSEMLKALNSSSIKKIELLTSPSAEFDAAGSGGMINIITKKNTEKGYGIDLKSGVTKGKYLMVTEGISSSLQTDRVKINASFDYSTPDRYISSSSGNTIVEDGRSVIIKRTNDASFKVKYYSYQAGVEWKVSTRQQLSATYNGYLDDFSAKKSSQVVKYTNDDVAYGIVKSSNSIVEPYYYDAANINYKFDIDTLGKYVTADAHYISYRNYSDGVMSTSNFDIYGNQTEANAILRSKQPGFISIISFKADATLPFEFLTLKAGTKYANVSNDNEYRFDSLLNNEYKEVVSMSNHFLYQEQITAAYLSGSKKLRKTNLNAGLRLEHTQAKGYTVKQSVSNQWLYTKLFPSFSIDHNFNETSKASISASRRIDRPAYSDLNPVRWYNDQYFFYSGNPFLKPEMTWLFSSAYTFKNKYVLTASYSRHNDYLSRRVIREDGTNALVSQSTNFGKMHRLDITSFIPFNLLPSWKIQFTCGLNYTSYPINQLNGTKNLSNWAGNLQLDQSIKLPGNISLELGSYWYSRDLWGIYKQQSIFYIDAGMKRTFFKNKLDAKLAVADLLNTYAIAGRSQTDYTDYYFRDKKDTRRISVVLLYHIGGKLQKGSIHEIEEQNRL
jgi:outer membrane receptor protein involved in Fe transport